MSKEEGFTPSQVGALLETMDKKIDFLAEGIAPIPERLEKIEERLTKVEIKLISVEDAVRIAIPSLTKRVNRLENKVGI